MAEHEMMDNMGTMPSMPTKPTSLLDTVKETLSPNTLMEKIKSSKDRLLEIAIYGGIGFISGFLLKKYSTYVGVCILLLIGLGVLHHLGVINIMISWDKVNDFFGIQAVQDMSADNILTSLWEWMKVNMVISISYIVGLFIGLKVG
jgi:uncharacterized membrane protein (Fun14 family)